MTAIALPCRPLPARLLRAALRGLAFACLALWAALALAQPQDVDAALDEARKQMDKVQQVLQSEEPPEESVLQSLRAAALRVQAGADGVAQSLAPELASVTARLDELGPAPEQAEAADVAAQRAQLEKSRSKLDAQIKLARLLSVEGGQAAEQLSALRRSQFQARLGERRSSILGSGFWTEFRQDLPRDLARTLELADELRQSAAATPLPVWLGLAGGVAGVILLRLQAGRTLFRLTATRVPPGRLRRSFLAMALVLLSVAVPGLIAYLVHVGLNWSGELSEQTDALLGRLSATVCFGGFVSGLAYALLSPYRNSWRLLPLSDQVAWSLRRYPAALGTAVVLVWLAEQLAARLNVTLGTAIAINALAQLLLSATLALALHRAHRIRRKLAAAAHEDGATLPLRPLWLVSAINLTWTAIGLGLVALLVGYAAFGNFAIKQLIWTLVVLATAYLLSLLIEDGFSTLLSSPPPDPQDKGDGQRPRARDQAAVLLSGMGRLAVVLFALVLLLAPFGEGPLELVQRAGTLPQGVTVGEIHIRPMAVLQALLVLALCLLGVRIFKRWLEQRYLPTTQLDPGMRVSAATLVGYVGVVVAVALSMSALGVGLERVAWVASALSVGIGFGLQAVVQNFVSGLILLAERPVKVGDWVSLGGVEGDIQRINVRATEIRMGDRSTVIVPNSEFITKTVRNVTHSNPQGVVTIKLPMPLDVDAEKVRALMLDAFVEHEGIMDAPAPTVHLDGIENGSLVFNGTGFVNSPRSSYGIRSAVLFDILRRLREADLSMNRPPTTVLLHEAGEAAQEGRPASAARPDGPAPPRPA
ncbi:DUF3772 domain-containing protein [Orrella sp. JC864]|uniref:DUF3772 domain-containing protein n=1 Tax=Orrella sp. JC864 TaxID=3120298 RepID=UPI0030081F7C